VAAGVGLPSRFPGPYRANLLLMTIRAQVSMTAHTHKSHAEFLRALDDRDLGDVVVLSIEAIAEEPEAVAS
jgi:hypothetical protein